MKKLWLVVFLLLSGVTNSLAQTAESYYAKGYKASQQRDAETAIDNFTKAIELNPKYSEAYYARGYVYGNVGRFNEAVADYSQALVLNPKDTKALYARASALQDMRSFDEAITDYNALLELNPKKAKTYVNNLGIIAHEKSEYEKAITFFNKAIELDPAYIRPYYNRALSNSLLGKYVEANVDNSKVLEMDPKDASAMNNRGINYTKMGEYDKAILDFSRAIELYPIATDPRHTPPYLGRAEANFRLGKMDAGFADCEKLIGLYPDYPAPYAVRSLGNQLKKDYAQAWEDARKSLSLGGAVPLDQLKSLRKETGLEPYDEELLAFGIKFIPPEGWKKWRETNKEVGSVFSFYNSENTALMTVVPPIPANAIERWLGIFMMGAKADSREKITLAGLPCDVLTSKMTEKNDTFENKVYSIGRNGMAFTILTAVRNKNYSDYAQDFDKALNQYEIFQAVYNTAPDNKAGQ